MILGATGDLTARKLLPALYRLAFQGYMPQRFAMVGVARREKSDASFREELTPGLRAPGGGPADPSALADFLGRLYYHRMSVEDASAYGELGDRLERLERSLGIPPRRRLFYLATSPTQIEPILRSLRASGLVQPPAVSGGWQRVVIEKPFGRDLESARSLNAVVAATLDETQVYRIDHYLGKETVQNLLSFRFANAIFEPLWNRRHIASIQITAAETVGMEGGRAGYYDTAGALRDMVQNHLMQLLCLVAMEPPSRFEADAIRNEKVKVLKTLDPMSPEETAQSTVRGQYGPGSILGRPVAGYREEPGVAADSTTETYAALRLKLDNWRWAGVPFFLRTGKRLPKRATEIAIEFRVPPVGIFQRRVDGAPRAERRPIAPNVLLLHIQPDEGISLMFDAKVPGMSMRTQAVKMDFRYGHAFARPSPEAYERLLLDALTGDSTLFTRHDEVEAAWAFVTSVLDGWAQAPPPAFPNYQAGEWGPQEAGRLFHPEEGSWRRL